MKETQEILEELKVELEYYPLTGKLLWARSRQGVKAQQEAGSLNNVKGYYFLMWKRKVYKRSRVIWAIMTGEWVDNSLYEIDHINRNRSDDRWINLRRVSRTLNRYNSKTQSNNTSGIRGVTWNKRLNKWLAQIKHKGKCTVLGTFEDIFTAQAARERAELEIYGVHTKDLPSGKKLF